MTLPLSQLVRQSDAPSQADGERPRDAAHIEWLETDGRGGFACSNVTLCPSRQYHGLLVTAPPGTAKRHLFLSGFLETVAVALNGAPDTVALDGMRHEGDETAGWPQSLQSFSLVPWPRATFVHGPYEIRREILMSKGRPAVLIRYSVGRAPECPPDADERLDGVALTLRPVLAFREADKLTVRNDVLRREVEEISNGIRCRLYDALPPMTLSLDTGEENDWTFDADAKWFANVEYETDRARGFDGREDLFSPGRFQVHLRPNDSVTLAATIDGAVEHPATLWRTESERRIAATPPTADLQGRCAVAADDFLYEGPGGRRGILAGFPWFGEWGRDTFIALPGLTLARGQLDACAEVLSGALPYLRDGLLPNIFGVDQTDSHYGSVDASLWFARAVMLYQRAGGSLQRVLDEYLPALIEIACAYRDGTAEGIAALGIRADEGMLIEAGSPTLNPTWMDANASGGAVTPRHGCAVEICALWYSLLAHLAELSRIGLPAGEPTPWQAEATLARKTFLARFWLEERGYLADTWRRDEVDDSVRPNMVLAASLELSPLRRAQRARVLAVAEAQLLTPFGLRTLAPGHESYVAHYTGGPEERDRAYHQGTVWPWLLGAFCEASLRVDATRANRVRLRALWDAFAPEIEWAGLNHISEVYDAEPPHRPGGSFAQAWNTAELLRAFALLDKTLSLGGARRA